MPGVWEHEAVARRAREWPALERLRAHVEVSPALAGMILVGSFARGEVDPLSADAPPLTTRAPNKWHLDTTRFVAPIMPAG